MSVDPMTMLGMAPGGAAPSSQTAPGQVPPAVGGAEAPMPPGAAPVQPGGAPIPGGPFQPGDPQQMAAMMQQMGGQGEKKPKSLVPATLAKHIADMLNQRKQSMAQFMADSFGLPRGIVNADEETLVRAWLKRRKDFDVTQARLDGVAEDEIADQAYPLRRPLINIGHPTFKERVEFAEKMATLAVDPKYAHLHNEDEDVPTPTAIIPSKIGPQGEDDLTPDDEEEE